ncbi:hypothetical protein SAMN06265222_103358 [Neorhodopirellula lusitana]|uniref:Uncharacterized protein n=1 Tax=Neorhodopirellula lusitana TaxID=445327 RepID=A0ABY1PZP4_9BACT|nr:hypothetical protein SAMN06265222_103358 [Neorhodopirellula lusitana]
MSVASKTVTRPWQMQYAFLSGPFYDHTLIVGVAFIAILSGYLVHVEPGLFTPVLFLDLWLLGYHHVISTFTKLAGTRQDRQENQFLLYRLPLIVIAAVVGCYLVSGIWSIVTIYFFWQWYHYTRQAYGISAFYQRKTGVKQPVLRSRLDHAAVWAIPVWGLVHRCTEGWETFIYQPVWLPALPAVASTVAMFAAIAVVSVWLALRVDDLAMGRFSYAPFMFLVSHHLVFYIAYVLTPDMTTGWLVANVWHNAQYILFVWLFNQNRFRGPEKEALSPLMFWLCQRSPYRTLMYFLVCIGITTVVYGMLDQGTQLIAADNLTMLLGIKVVLFQSINFHHYVVDSYIWKARKKSHQEIMNVAA